jgi:hypothetical protein
LLDDGAVEDECRSGDPAARRGRGLGRLGDDRLLHEVLEER